MTDGFVSRQIHYDEFIPMFESQYPQYPWKQVEVWLYALQFQPIHIHHSIQWICCEVKFTSFPISIQLCIASVLIHRFPKGFSPQLSRLYSLVYVHNQTQCI